MIATVLASHRQPRQVSFQSELRCWVTAMIAGDATGGTVGGMEPLDTTGLVGIGRTAGDSLGGNA